MPLASVVELLDDIDETYRALYAPVEIKDADGTARSVFALDLEGVESHPAALALANALARQKSEITRLKQIAAGGTTADEVDRLRELEATAADRDDAHEKEIADLQAAHAAALAAAKNEFDAVLMSEKSAHQKTRGALRATTIDGQVRSALVDAGVQPGELLNAAQALLLAKVRVDEGADGGIAGVFETAAGDLPIGAFIQQWIAGAGQAFLPAPKGSGAEGPSRSSSARTPAGEKNPYSKAHWNLTAQGRLLTDSPDKADRLARAAGHKSASGARIASAK